MQEFGTHNEYFPCITGKLVYLPIFVILGILNASLDVFVVSFKLIMCNAPKLNGTKFIYHKRPTPGLWIYRT